MAVLKIKFDTTSREWEVSDLEHGTFRDEECDLNFDDLYIHWGFKNGSANSIVFDKLTFGCTITKDGVEVANITRPSSPRGSYIRTESEFMEVDHIDTDAGSTYNLNIWVNEQGIRNEKTLEISIPSYPDYALEYSNTHPEQPDYDLFISQEDES